MCDKDKRLTITTFSMQQCTRKKHRHSTQRLPKPRAGSMPMRLIWMDDSFTHSLTQTEHIACESATHSRHQLCRIYAAPTRSRLGSCSDGSRSGPHTAGHIRPTWSSRQSLQHDGGENDKMKNESNTNITSMQNKKEVLETLSYQQSSDRFNATFQPPL